MVAVSGFILLATAVWCTGGAQAQNASTSPAAATQSSGPEYSIGANFAWSTFNDEVNFQPTCIVFPNTTKHVQTAMKAIFQNNAEYSVQAGGHSGMTGWNTVENGILISFINMMNSRVTSYDSQSDTITLLPGIHWGDATSALQQYGVAPVGARGPLRLPFTSTVGTGLLLGGGISYLSSPEGYAADNFVSLDVVLVNGTLVTATVDNGYADLFKALKCGGNRFGIYPNSSSEAVLAALAHFVHDTTNPNAGTCAFIIIYNIFGFNYPNYLGNNSSPEIELDIVLVYNGTEASFNQSFAEFLSIPYTSIAVQPLSYLDLLEASTHRSTSTWRLTDCHITTSLQHSLHHPTLLSNPIVPPLGTGGYHEILFQVTALSTPGLPFFLNEADANQEVFATYGGYKFLKQVYAKYDSTRFDVEHTQGPLGL
ncbi:hypothetical protein DFH05DRAFT_1532540 [Lentinula detonsa]|uniref:FAD-binding PCMH-type domain-containing protein n=1 Tax=Lentinula detonsa TaxID=2804962 RepID=A0A9W8PD04_9AGAR|nr:hypothetical protein DFH05DRAFT_1532540 [Lentinula detonsa]